VAVKTKRPLTALKSSEPSWVHSKSLLKATQNLKQVVYWSLPRPAERENGFEDLIDWDHICDDSIRTKRNLSLVPKRQIEFLLSQEGRFAAPGYKRTRNGQQVLELRFDGLAGCLRVPRGGSSRQYLVLKQGRKLSTRLLSTHELTALMGAPANFKIPGSYNEIYAAMGDAVAFPVVRFLTRELLLPLAREVHSQAVVPRREKPVTFRASIG
jgi:DNA (cytosine-5)-methyltransferase 1